MADTTQLGRPVLPVERPASERPERGAETAPVRAPEQGAELGVREHVTIQVPVQVPVAPSTPTYTATPLHREIEKVLEEDMVPLFLELNADQRKQFRAGGTIAANKIEVLLRSTGDVLREVLRAIREWLSLLPGVSRFFIEREAKIKAEKILFLRQRGGG